MATIMLQRLKDPGAEIERVVIRPTLIERRSTASVRKS